MCLIVVKNIGVKLPDREKLHNGFINNPDGVGLALLKANKHIVYIKKDFADFEAFYTWITDNVAIDDLCVIHFRLATSGKVDFGNRHPFPITYNKSLLRKSTLYCKFSVAHNGVLSDYSIKNSKYSDTQKFVVDILANIKYKLDNRAIQKLVTSYIGHDKLAIIDGVNRKLILFGEYIKEEDILYSNSGYSYNKNTYFENNKNVIACDLCDNTKKVIYVEKEKSYLCKRCRRGIKRQGWNKWVEIISKEIEDTDADIEEDILSNEFNNITGEKKQYREDRRKLDAWEKLVKADVKTKTKVEYDTTLAQMYNSLTNLEKKRVNQLIVLGKDFEKAIGQVLVENTDNLGQKLGEKESSTTSAITTYKDKSRKRRPLIDKYGYIIDDDYDLYQKSKYKHYKNTLLGKKDGEENENYCG